MTTMTVLPRGHEWTVADLEALPDDGLRYELVDGTLLVSAAPSKLHQRVVGNLHVLLRAACPASLEVFLAPTDYQPTRRRSLQPDLLVVARDDPGPAAVTTPLALAVEVLSPSSRRVDTLLKRALYEESGVAAYWLVDPDAPAVTAWTLVDGSYATACGAEGDAVLRVDVPFAVELVPAELLR
jgi:Uma2 family endonuclease